MTERYREFTAIFYHGEPLQSDALESEAAPAEGRVALGNLMSVLAPATPPPPPLNARVICRMGLTSPKPRARAEPAASSRADDDPESADTPGLFTKRRRASRTLRTTNLRAAAPLD